MRLDIFERPRLRSRNVIGTSTMRPPVALGEVGHLHLEAVAVGPHAVEVDAREVVAVVGAEAGGGVVHREAEHGAGVETATARDRAPQPLPVGDRAAGHVARPDGEVGARLDRGEQLRAAPPGRARGRRPSRSSRRSPREADPEPGAVRGAEARLLRAGAARRCRRGPRRASRPGRRCRRGCRRRSRGCRPRAGAARARSRTSWMFSISL